MLTYVQASQIVHDCIRFVSHVDVVDPARSLDEAAISNQPLVDQLIDLIVNHADIGVPREGHRIDRAVFADVNQDTLVNSLITIVRDNSIRRTTLRGGGDVGGTPITVGGIGGDSTTGSDR